MCERPSKKMVWGPYDHEAEVGEHYPDDPHVVLLSAAEAADGNKKYALWVPRTRRGEIIIDRVEHTAKGVTYTREFQCDETAHAAKKYLKLLGVPRLPEFL